MEELYSPKRIKKIKKTIKTNKSIATSKNGLNGPGVHTHVVPQECSRDREARIPRKTTILVIWQKTDHAIVAIARTEEHLQHKDVSVTDRSVEDAVK